MPATSLDLPRCLNLESTYVGPPRSPAAGATRPAPHGYEPPDPGGTAAFRQRAVRECMDTIGVLRAYREPLPGESWRVPLASERRLLAQVHAIIGLGEPALQQASELALDEDVPDPARVFAALFVLASVEGSAWNGPAIRVFTAACLRNPAEMTAAVEALCLGPNPDLTSHLEGLLVDERPSVRSAAIRVLAFRGALSESAWADAIRDAEESVVAAAAAAPVLSYAPEVRKRLLSDVLARPVERLVRPALRAGLAARLGEAHERAAEIAGRDPKWAGALQLLAMFGVLSDARLIESVLATSATVDGPRAASLLGCVRLVPALVDLLERPDIPAEVIVEARGAISFITGFHTDESQDSAQLRREWTRHASAFDPDRRYRFGRPLTAAGLLDSLRTGAGTRDWRQNLYLELTAATGSGLARFSAYDFVSVQERALDAIERWLCGPDASVRSSQRG